MGEQAGRGLTTLPVEATPDELGQIEEDGLETEDERHPLVVADLLVLPREHKKITREAYLCSTVSGMCSFGLTKNVFYN